MKSPTKSRTNSMSSSVDRVSITPRKKKTLSAYRKTPPQPFPEDESFYSRQKSLPEGWILRIAEDGVTEFYHNQYTGGLRWTHPGIEDSDDDTEDDYYEMPRNQSQPRFESDNEDTTTHESFEDYQDFGKVKKKDTASTLSLEAKDIDKSNVTITESSLFILHLIYLIIYIYVHLNIFLGYGLLVQANNATRKSLLRQFNNTGNNLGL
jgi:hypothetical protein